MADGVQLSGVGVSLTPLNANQVVGGWYIFDQNNTESTVHSGDTNLTTLRTVAIPANTLKTNSRVRITLVNRCTGTAGTKTFTVSFGGSNIWQLAYGATILSGAHMIGFANRNSTSSQIVTNLNVATGFNTSTADIITMAVDCTADQNILIQGQLANSGDSIANESYCVEIVA